MSIVINEDDLDDLTLQRRPKGVTEDAWLRSLVDTLLEWAESPDYVLEGVWRSHVLSVAAEHLTTLGDLDRAVEVAQRAADLDDPEALEATVSLIEALLARGSVADAEAAAMRVRAALRADPRSVHASTIERIGEEFAYARQLATAERWFTLGVRNAEVTDASDVTLARAMSFRASVRRRAGKASDVMDLDARALANSLGWSTDEDPLLYADDA